MTARRNFPTDTNGTSRIWLSGGYASDGITPLRSMEIFTCAQGSPHANADRDSDGNAHTDSDAHCDSDGYAYADSYANSHSDSYAYFNAEADAENCANSKASPYSSTAAVTFAIKKKDTV